MIARSSAAAGRVRRRFLRCRRCVRAVAQRSHAHRRRVRRRRSRSDAAVTGPGRPGGEARRFRTCRLRRLRFGERGGRDELGRSGEHARREAERMRIEQGCVGVDAGRRTCRGFHGGRKLGIGGADPHTQRIALCRDARDDGFGCRPHVIDPVGVAAAANIVPHTEGAGECHADKCAGRQRPLRERTARRPSIFISVEEIIAPLATECHPTPGPRHEERLSRQRPRPRRRPQTQDKPSGALPRRSCTKRYVRICLSIKATFS